MDPFRLFATYESELPLKAQDQALQRQGWLTTAQQNALRCRRGPICLTLEASGDDLYLLRGELETNSSRQVDTGPLLEFFRHVCTHFQLDVFEEDGRLVRRMTNFD